MIDNFNIHTWKLKQAINELENRQCPDCGCKMEGQMCNECGYMEEGATFTDKHDDNPKLKGDQKDLPDELQAKIVKKEATLGKSNKFSIGDKLQTYGGEEPVTVVGVQPHLAAALKDDKNPLVVSYLKKALRQGLVDREQASQPWYLVKFEGGLPDTDLRYWAEDELMNGELNEGEDHEVAMAKSSLQSIMSSASKLMMMLGDEERNIPGWIQDHITNAENYIDQAAQGFHELENNNEEN